jgi:hypothetical protein
MVVMLVIAIVSGLVSFRGGAFSYWQREGTIRKLSETISFLHHRAVSDRVNYRIEFSMPSNQPHSFRVGEALPARQKNTLTNDKDPTLDAAALAAINQETGLLSARLSDFLTPQTATGNDIVEPKNFPSLAKPEIFPNGLSIRDIKTTRDTVKATGYSDQEKPYINFSPRGFSEFAVIHLMLGDDPNAIVTLLVNPFTGLTTLYRDDKDFEWTLARDKK